MLSRTDTRYSACVDDSYESDSSMSALQYCYSLFSKLCGYNVVFCVHFDEMIHCKPNSGSWFDYRKLLHVITIHGVPNTGPTASGATAVRHINKPYTNCCYIES